MLVKIIISVIKLYQSYISPLFPGRCRFYPSCSQYAIEVLQKYGLLRGTGKTVWRILRCNPFSVGGYDPS